jgi:MSHA pilin protein MshA
MLKEQRAFSLVKLIIAVLIVGVLIAVAVPRYVHLQLIKSSVSNLPQARPIASVQAGFVLARQHLKGYPTVAQLATYVKDSSATAVNTGVQMDDNRIQVIVPTFTDSACTTATNMPGNTVKCVGPAQSPVHI